MPRIPRLARVLLAFAALSAPVHAGVVLTTFPADSSLSTDLYPNQVIGEAFQAGTDAVTSLSVRIQLDPTMYATEDSGATLHLQLYDSTISGHIGSVVYDDFIASPIGTSGGLTAQADPGQIVFSAAPNDPYTLTTGDVYWLVLSDQLGADVAWQNTDPSVPLQSNYGYTIPLNITTYSSDSNSTDGFSDSTNYYPYNNGGPQTFDLETPAGGGTIATPEPATIISALTSALGLLGAATWNRRRSRVRNPEPAA